MRLNFFWNIYCCSHHLRPRNVPTVGNRTGHFMFSQGDSVYVGHSLSGLMSTFNCFQKLSSLGSVAKVRVLRDIPSPL